MLGFDEAEGSVKAKTKPSGFELGLDWEDVDGCVVVGGMKELELA